MNYLVLFLSYILQIVSDLLMLGHVFRSR